jgi:ParB family transcriptional regulator, chromosome partitioning protein
LERPVDLGLTETASDNDQTGKTRLRGAYTIALERIEADPQQPRREFEETALQELANSIRERGVRQPIRVIYQPESKLYRIVSGERRFRAAKNAGLSSIPCIVDDLPQAENAQQQILIDQLVENWQRQDLNVYELHDALLTLRDTLGLSQDAIVRMTGKPKSEVSRILSLEKIQPQLEAELRQDVSGTFSRRHLLAVARIPEDEQEAFVEQIRQEQWTGIEAEKRAAQRLKPAKKGQVESPTMRKYVVGGATIAITFRKANVTTNEILLVLDKLRSMLSEGNS